MSNKQDVTRQPKQTERKNKMKLKDRISHPLLKMPSLVKSLKGTIIVTSIITAVILDALSFTLKGAEIALDKQLIPLAIIMLMLYFSQRIIESSIKTFQEVQNDNFSEINSASSIEIVMDIVNTCRSKVYKKDQDGKLLLMDNTEMIIKSKMFLSAVWNFWWTIPKAVSNSLILITMTIAIIVVEFRDNPGKDTYLIMGLLFICIVVYFILGKRRIKLFKSFRKVKNENKSKEEVMFTEIKNIDFISTDDFEYHANKFKDHLRYSNGVLKKEHLKLNNVFIQRSIISSGFMIAILLIKLAAATEFNYTVILNVVAVSSVYSTILSKIGEIISNFEFLADTVLDINDLYPTFENISKVYDEEKTKEFVNIGVEKIEIKEFSATQDPKHVYVLKNENEFMFQKGDCVLLQGPTGCGKSTAIMLLTGKLRIQDNPIRFDSGKSGYLQSISYQTDRSMANNYVLNELILSDNTCDIDKKKLMEILKGLSLYDEFLKVALLDKEIFELDLSDDDSVLILLESRLTSQFSSGQKQRLALAKLLYTMSDNHQVIALDEAFNRLDDETALKCINFVKEYCQKGETKRILLMATHQVNLVRPVCNKELSFNQDMGTSYLINQNI